MNDRIKELAEQAGASVHREQTRSGDWVDFTDYAGFDLKKFAELIIRECANTVVDRCEIRGVEDAKRAEYHARRIKEHFGVKE